MRNTTVKTAPVGHAITVDEVKSFLRITSTYEDVLIESLIAVATTTLEAYTKRDFIERTYTVEYDQILYSGQEVYPFVKLYRSPLKSVTSVQVSNGGTFEDESHQVKDQPGFGRILFDEYLRGMSGDDIPFPLRIEFVAGYGEASDVPAAIKQALLHYVNYLYSNRGDCAPECGMGIPIEVRGLLGPYKIIDTFTAC